CMVASTPWSVRPSRSPRAAAKGLAAPGPPAAGPPPAATWPGAAASNGLSEMSPENTSAIDWPEIPAVSRTPPPRSSANASGRLATVSPREVVVQVGERDADQDADRDAHDARFR